MTSLPIIPGRRGGLEVEVELAEDRQDALAITSPTAAACGDVEV
jgi:hypothetical protein